MITRFCCNDTILACSPSVRQFDDEKDLRNDQNNIECENGEHWIGYIAVRPEDINTFTEGIIEKLELLLADWKKFQSTIKVPYASEAGIQ